MRIYLPSDTEIQRQRDSDRGGATYRERDRDRNRQGMRQSQRETETKTAKARQRRRQRQTETNGQTVTDRQTGGADRVRPTDFRGRGRIRAGQKEGDPKGGRKRKAEKEGGGVRVASLPE